VVIIEGKRVRFGLNVHSPCNLENGLEPNAFLADVTVNTGFCALTDTANGRDIRRAEAVLIRIDDNLILGQGKAECRELSFLLSSIVAVVFGVLDELVDESSFFLIEIIGEPNIIVS
jgi:hypothetical protein